MDGQSVAPGTYACCLPTGSDVTITFPSTTNLLHGTYGLDTRGGAIQDGTSHSMRVDPGRPHGGPHQSVVWATCRQEAALV